MQVVSEIQAIKIRQIGCGEGRNSEVFIAEDPQLCGEIVLKEIPVSKFPDPKEYFKEAQQLYKNKYKYIVPIMYACKDSNYIRIAIPYFSKGSIQSIIKHNPLPISKIIEYAHQFLTGLHHIHSNGFIHFDIKPTNILIHDDGHAMLSDFGQMRPTDSFGVAETPPMYPWHFPPEALVYDRATKQLDIYQAGLTLYRMCNGEDFFVSQKPATIDELRFKISRGRFPDRDKFLPHIPRRLRGIIKRALKVDPADRYQTALEFIDELGQIQSNLEWNCNIGINKIIWTKCNIDREYCIEIVMENNVNYLVKGYTKRISDGMIRRKNDWCGGPFTTFKQAENAVAKIFKEME